MICYKDRTYCGKECGNNDCIRNITDEVMLDIKAYARHFNTDCLLISVADFKTDTCGYIKKGK